MVAKISSYRNVNVGVSGDLPEYVLGIHKITSPVEIPKTQTQPSFTTGTRFWH